MQMHSREGGMAARNANNSGAIPRTHCHWIFFLSSQATILIGDLDGG